MIEGIDTKLALIGLGIVSEAMNDGAAMAYIVMGRYDAELKEVLKMQGAAPDSPELDEKLNNLKDYFRTTIKNIFEMAAEEDRKQELQQREKVLAELKSSNDVHPMGTIAEIATRYGISKSEVRRMKAAGTLEQLMK
jgi:hypothetical protein